MNTFLTLYLSGVAMTAVLLLTIVLRLPEEERPELSVYVGALALWAIIAWPLTWASIAVWIWEGWE